MKNLLLTLLLTGTASLMAAVYENVVFYKDQGSWNSSIAPNPANTPDAGRISWDGRTPLILKPKGKGYDLSKADYLSWMIYLKDGQSNVRYEVILTVSDGKKYTLKILPHSILKKALSIDKIYWM